MFGVRPAPGSPSGRMPRIAVSSGRKILTGANLYGSLPQGLHFLSNEVRRQSMPQRSEPPDLPDFIHRPDCPAWAVVLASAKWGTCLSTRTRTFVLPDFTPQCIPM